MGHSHTLQYTIQLSLLGGGGGRYYAAAQFTRLDGLSTNNIISIKKCRDQRTPLP